MSIHAIQTRTEENPMTERTPGWNAPETLPGTRSDIIGELEAEIAADGRTIDDYREALTAVTRQRDEAEEENRKLIAQFRKLADGWEATAATRKCTLGVQSALLGHAADLRRLVGEDPQSSGEGQ